MGWWKTRDGHVIGDPAADFIESFGNAASRWVEPSDLPEEVQARLDAMYVEGIGRKPTDKEIEALLGFCG